MNWNNITYRQFQELKEALKIEEIEDKIEACVIAVYGKDIINKPLNEYREACNKLDFMKDEIPTNYKVKNVTVNGREYYFDGMLNGIVSAAQYIDFQNYLRAKDEVKEFSVFFIPVGHKYNDGYDMEQVFEDVQDMPITIVMSASFFFVRQLEISIRLIQSSLQSMKMSKKMKKAIINSLNLASYPKFSNFAK